MTNADLPRLVNLAAGEEPRIGERVDYERWVADRRQLATPGRTIRLDCSARVGAAWRIMVLGVIELMPSYTKVTGGFWRQRVTGIALGRCAEGEWR